MRHLHARLALALASAPLLQSCLSVRADEPASVGASVNVGTAYWFRGVPVNTGGVIQGDLATTLPLADGSLLDLSVWGNMALTGDSGNGIEPDGNGLAFTEIDTVAVYTRSYDGYDVSVGILSYNLPNGVGASTTELYSAASFQALGLSHALSVYYDFDLLDGFYMAYSGGWGRTLDDKTALDVAWNLGAMGGDQARGYFGVDENGLSDLSLSGTLSHAFDPATTLSATLALIKTLDSDYADALDAAGRDDLGVVVMVGTAWSF